MSLKDGLKAWAARTVGLYHNLAMTEKDGNLAFYTQTNLTEVEKYPELLVLAINPGSGGPYFSESGKNNGQVDNKIWKEWGIRDGHMDGDTLLKGNAFWWEREKWHLWKRLRIILSHWKEHVSLLDDEHRFVFTNMILFNTSKAKGLPKVAFEKCPQSTIELIKLLQPRRILCLGRKDCFQLLCKHTGVLPTELIPSELSYGRWNNIPVYGIPHTSKRYSYEEMNLIGKGLGYMFEHEGEMFTSDNIQKRFITEIEQWKGRKSNSSLSAKLSVEVSKGITSRLLELGIENYDTKHPEIFLLPGDLNLSVAKQGYVAIRHKSYSQQYTKESTYYYQQELIALLEKYQYAPSRVWLGQKYFKKYGYTVQEVIDGIVGEVKELCMEISVLVRPLV